MVLFSNKTIQIKLLVQLAIVPVKQINVCFVCRLNGAINYRGVCAEVGDAACRCTLLNFPRQPVAGT